MRLTEGAGGPPLAAREVVLMFENPPGGMLRLRTDAQGALRVPARYKGLRVMVGTECDEKNACAHVSAPRRLDAEAVTIDVSGGLNLHP